MAAYRLEGLTAMNSRLPVLFGIVLLILSVSLLDLSFLPLSLTGILPYLVIGLVLFVIMSRGGCCGRRCGPDNETADGPTAA